MTDAMPVHPSNTDQARAWDGDEGAYWAAHADYFDRAVAAYHRPFVDAAGIGVSDRVLDVGCGTGQTTRDAARVAMSGSALGVDLSAAMLEHARRRAAEDGVTNATFLRADAQIHPFDPGTFDVAVSRTGSMFFGDPVAAFANIARALAPGGRLVLLTWQPLAGNEWLRELAGALSTGRERPAPPADAPGPLALSDPDRVRSLLTAAGFAGVELEGTTAGMWFGSDVEDAFRFVLGLLGWMLDGLGSDARAAATGALRANLAAHHTAEGVVYGSATWTVRATRR